MVMVAHSLREAWNRAAFDAKKLISTKVNNCVTEKLVWEVDGAVWAVGDNAWRQAMEELDATGGEHGR